MGTILIRDAISTDKSSILNFCKDTFSWGDYIEYVWDYWLCEGNLLVLQKDYPMGMCHAFFSKNQVWIEGIRIHPNFRRQRLASRLIKHTELLAKEKNVSFAFMLIDIENFSSLSMTKSLNYQIFQTWNFYSVLPEFKNNKIHFGNVLNITKATQYVKSWRWLELNDEILQNLSKQNKIVFSNESGNICTAILTDSEHFDKTLIVTLFSGSQNDTLNIISFIQNYGAENNYKKIQILTKEKLPFSTSLEHKLTFHLMKKFLC